MLHTFFSRAIAAAAVIGIGLSTVPVAAVAALPEVATSVTPVARAVAAATPIKDTVWDAGHIMSDALMFDGSTMDVAQVQAFLNAKGSACETTSTNTCLKNARFATGAKPAVAPKCSTDLTAKTNQSAAQVIVAVARACNVSPKVLLVTLQKEQGLVTATAPTAAKFNIATGYACYDGQPCDAQFFGFFNQVYWAARAYQAYRFEPFQYGPGVESQIRLNTRLSCGTKAVTVHNLATKALYNYTPYTPNAASIANPYKEGDSCSSYGNRNFWLYFNAWFGNSRAGDWLVGDTYSTFFAIENNAWRLPAGSDRLRASLAPVDVKATVSASYLSKLTSAGNLSPLVRDTEGNVFLLANSTRFQLSDCDAAASFGFACASSAVLPDAALERLPLSSALLGRLDAWIASSSGSHFIVSSGKKRQVADPSSLSTATSGPKLALDSVFVNTIPYGVPIIKTATPALVAGTDDVVVFGGSNSYVISPAIRSQIPVMTWLGSARGSLDAGSVAKMSNVRAFPGVFTVNSNDYILTSSGRRPTIDGEQWTSSVSSLDTAIAAKIPIGSRVNGPRFVRSSPTTGIYLIAEGERRSVASADIPAIAKTRGISGTVSVIPSFVIASSSLGSPLYPAGSVMRESGGSQSWFLDGDASRIRISASQALELTGSSAYRSVSSTSLAGYAIGSGEALPGVVCDGISYLAVSGIVRAVRSTEVAEFGSVYGFKTLDAATCASLDVRGSIRTLLKSGSTYYSVEDGARRVISVDEYQALSADRGVAVSVSTYFVRLLPIA